MGQAGEQEAKADPKALMRNMTFDELPHEEKTQRLRLEVIALRALVESQQQLIERLMVHQHDARGDMVVPMSRSGVGLGNFARDQSGNLVGSRRDPLR